ncbi:hypothetical protein J0S82_012656 [Galemys pyrenaicus]|uniref:Uncharacterized protein n=1 Tax=Galemys pyrenaicus TaxID=202257 RepID=A0A8J6DW73_GALPY|nr:hypothetical protein J0S82_012656 [Galemys pyrenaicus]
MWDETGPFPDGEFKTSLNSLTFPQPTWTVSVQAAEEEEAGLLVEGVSLKRQVEGKQDSIPRKAYLVLPPGATASSAVQPSLQISAALLQCCPSRATCDHLQLPPRVEPHPPLTWCATSSRLPLGLNKEKATFSSSVKMVKPSGKKLD